MFWVYQWSCYYVLSVTCILMLICMLCILSHHVLFFHIFYFHLTYVYSVWSFTVPCLLHETKAQYSIRTGKYSVRMTFVSGF